MFALALVNVDADPPWRHHTGTAVTTGTTTPAVRIPTNLGRPTPRTRRSPIRSTLTGTRTKPPRDNVDIGQRGYNAHPTRDHPEIAKVQRGIPLAKSVVGVVAEWQLVLFETCCAVVR